MNEGERDISDTLVCAVTQRHEAPCSVQEVKNSSIMSEHRQCSRARKAELCEGSLEGRSHEKKVYFRAMGIL